jgi:hypothetical protein
MESKHVVLPISDFGLRTADFEIPLSQTRYPFNIALQIALQIRNPKSAFRN